MIEAITFRVAVESDWQAIQGLNLQIFQAELSAEPSSNLAFPFSPEAIEYFKTSALGLNDHVAFVCEDQGKSKVVAYAIAKMIAPQQVTHRVGIRLAQLHTLGVDVDYRGRGIGKTLTEMTKKWALSRGANRIRVVAYAGNATARALYSRTGFREFEVAYEATLDSIELGG